MLANMNLVKIPTKEAIIEFAIRGLKEMDWITGYDYSNISPKKFKTEMIPNSKKQNPFYNIYTYYVYAISQYFDIMKEHLIPAQTLDELKVWNGKGKFCIYTSVLLWSLLYDEGIFSSDEMRLVQGVYKHPNQGILGLLTGGQQLDHIGVHAWLEVCNGSVLDMAIVQEQAVFDFDNAAFIMEKIPEGMELTGWSEEKDTIKKYISQIEVETKKPYYEWIKYHKEQAVKMFFNDLKLLIKAAA